MNELRPTIGDNVLTQFLNNRGDTTTHLYHSKPAAIVIMDDWEYATLLATALPETLVIHRFYNEKDQNYVESGITPQQLIGSFPVSRLPNLYIQLHNEPSGYVNVGALVTYTVECMTLAREQGKRLAVLNHGVGHPATILIMDGAYDPVLRQLTDGFHLLGQHEYFVVDPRMEPELVGRVVSFIGRAKNLNIPRPKIVITESGRDRAGGHDGYRSVPGMTDEKYFELLKAQSAIYAPYGIPMCVFCLGRGGDSRWITYDYQNSQYILSAMEQYNQGVPMATSATPLPSGIATKLGVLRLSSIGKVPRIFRSSPTTNGTQVGVLYDGARVEFAEAMPFSDQAYPWYWVKASDGKVGWMMQMPGVDILELPVSDEEKERRLELAELHEQLSTIHMKIARVLKG